MYAFQLPAVIPPAGTEGGPPLPEAHYNFGGMPMPGDLRLMFLNCIRDPQQLQPMWDHMQAAMQAEVEKRKTKSASTR